jgi:hypothetical protein
MDINAINYTEKLVEATRDGVGDFAGIPLINFE